MAKKLSECSSEVIEQNFLKEDPEISFEEQIVIAREIPEYQKIIFINNRDQGIPLLFHYCSKTHPLKHYELIPGQQYDLPVEVIKHLEGQNSWDPYACHERMYSRRMRHDGVSEIFPSSYKQNFICKVVR